MTPYDPADSRYNNPDKMIHWCDAVGRLEAVSAPPSSGAQHLHLESGYLAGRRLRRLRLVPVGVGGGIQRPVQGRPRRRLRDHAGRPDQERRHLGGLGRYPFTSGGTNLGVSVSDNANGTVVADAVKLVRDNSADADNENKNFTYRYDPNGNLVRVDDRSPDAPVDSYVTTYDGLNRVARVEEKTGCTVRNTTSFTYDENANVRTRTHDSTWSQFDCDVAVRTTTSQFDYDVPICWPR